MLTLLYLSLSYLKLNKKSYILVQVIRLSIWNEIKLNDKIYLQTHITTIERIDSYFPFIIQYHSRTGVPYYIREQNRCLKRRHQMRKLSRTRRRCDSPLEGDIMVIVHERGTYKRPSGYLISGYKKPRQRALFVKEFGSNPLVFFVFTVRKTQVHCKQKKNLNATNNRYAIATSYEEQRIICKQLNNIKFRINPNVTSPPSVSPS